MEEFLHEYGYFALSLGTFLEGETAVMVASSLVNSGFFNGPYTVIFAFFGAFTGDMISFTIGRLNGKYYVERRPVMQARMVPVQNFFETNRIAVLLSYRFLYGFRTIIPIMIGMSKIRTLTFLGYCATTNLLWATIVSSVGYVAGGLFQLTPKSFEENLLFVILGFGAFGLTVGLTTRYFVAKRMGV
ncbi:MAG TPA: DedA family protein [Cyclobacteriaceae bacterium]|nr:DedA family protein [Cyclobacteriaceae bacterium]